MPAQVVFPFLSSFAACLSIVRWAFWSKPFQKLVSVAPQPSTLSSWQGNRAERTGAGHLMGICVCMYLCVCLSVCLCVCLCVIYVPLCKGIWVPRCTRRTSRGHWVSCSVTLCLVSLRQVDSLNLELAWHTASPSDPPLSSPSSAGVTGVQTATPS